LHVRVESLPQEPQFNHPHFDKETRIVETTIGRIVIASMYVPNGNKDLPGKLAFLREMEQYAKETMAGGHELLICGDLNVARTDQDVHPRERKPKPGQLPEERELFERVIGAGLVDLGRSFDPDNDGLFTWWAPWREMRQRNIGWRLDYILASQQLARAATSCIVLKDVGTSDHGPVVATFDAAALAELNQAPPSL
jgi:exodeoxyribonuclease-3